MQNSISDALAVALIIGGLATIGLTALAIRHLRYQLRAWRRAPAVPHCAGCGRPTEWPQTICDRCPEWAIIEWATAQRAARKERQT